MDAIDRKFKIFARNATTGKTYTHHDALLLCAKDAAVPAALFAYKQECERLGASPEHIRSIELLYNRVKDFQAVAGGGRIPTTISAEVARCLHGKKAYTGSEERPWEPVDDLMVQALDSNCTPIKGEDLQPDEHQNYCCTVIGFDLDDPEGCRSIIDITTGEGQEADEALANMVVASLQLLARNTTPSTCTWTQPPGSDMDGTDIYQSSCGAQLVKVDDDMEYCYRCGQKIEIKEES